MDAPIEKSDAGTLSSASLLERLGSSTAGLSAAQAAERQGTYGPNVLTKDRTTAARVLLRQFESPLVYFLIAAAALSFATKDLSDGSIIVVILLLNAALGFSQEYRSERAVEALAHYISSKVSVLRAGVPTVVEAPELVPGDVVVLEQGDIVPADLKLLEASSVNVDESQLTGESVAVAKAVQVNDATAGDGSLVFTGSVVTSGRLTGVAYATGNETAFGRIAALSRGVHKVTQYQRSLQSFSALLMKIVLVSLAVTVGIKLIINQGSAPVVPLLIFVIALAVSVVPEALPVIATLTMARGAVEMAKERVVVKRLSSLEDLGDVTLLCTDKTGTLTEGKLTVTGLSSSDEDLLKTLVSASEDPASKGLEGTQAAFDAAFDAFIPEPVKQQASSYTIVAQTPFDPAARRRRVLLAEAGSTARTLVVIGSPETLLDLAASPRRDQYLEQMVTEGKQGMRHLGVAYRQVDPTEPDDPISLEQGLSFLGVVTFSDPLRPGTAETLGTAAQLGVSVKILTGDSVEVAEYVAGRVGLVQPGAPVRSGSELTGLSPTELVSAARQSNVFARVSPEQKYELIEALKHSEVVGYEGDGINDAPSLKLADVGIAVDSATDVAKANADIILLDRKLAVIIDGIKKGRAIFTNINKYIVYTMVGNFGNFIALSLLYLLATSLPLLPRQLLLMSLLTDVPLVAISTDSVDVVDLSRPSKSDARQLLSVSLVLGSLTALAELLFFLTIRGQKPSVSETSLYLFLSFTQLVVIFSVRNRDHFWKASRASRPLLIAMVSTGVVALIITYIPATARVFLFTGPSLREIGLVFLWSALYFIVLDIVKVAYYKVTARRGPQPIPSALARRTGGATAPQDSRVG